jgi:nucleotide-binding universal stress UspA family protein
MYTAVLAPMDGTDHAMWAAEQAVDLAAKHGATLYALSVIDTRRYEEPALSSAELETDELEDAAHDIVDHVADIADAMGVDTVTRVTHGIPHEAICDYADDVGADVVVLGVRGRRADEKPMGDVAHHVVTEARVDVFTLAHDRADIAHPA